MMDAPFQLIVSKPVWRIDAGLRSVHLISHIRGYVEKEAFQGVVLVAKDGHVLLERAYGEADREKNKPNQIDTKFLIGSFTKSFTASLLLKLVEQGVVDLNQPINRYLPELKQPWAAEVTLHHLLKHQHGLPLHLERMVTLGSEAVSSEQILTIIADAKSHFPAGSQYEYGNVGYHLAAIVIERLTRLSFEDALRQHIFVPLKMANSGTESGFRPAPTRANGYSKDTMGITRDENNVSYALGAGDIYSTASDLYRFGQGLFGAAVLKPATLDTMFKPDSEKFGFYGYGFRIQAYLRAGETKASGSLIRHGGSMDGFLSNFHHYREDNLTVIVLANIRSFPIRNMTHELKEISLGLNPEARSRESSE